jgi:hypothetical protein
LDLELLIQSIEESKPHQVLLCFAKPEEMSPRGTWLLYVVDEGSGERLTRQVLDGFSKDSEYREVS